MSRAEQNVRGEDRDPAETAASLYADHEETVDDLAERDDDYGAIARALKDLAQEADGV